MPTKQAPMIRGPLLPRSLLLGNDIKDIAANVFSADETSCQKYQYCHSIKHKSYVGTRRGWYLTGREMRGRRGVLVFFKCISKSDKKKHIQKAETLFSPLIPKLHVYKVLFQKQINT